MLHVTRDGWHFTALFSNTAQAHQLGRTSDWVVIYYYDDEHTEGQHTVVSETHGPLAGRRVIPLRDRNPTRRTPVVTFALIFATLEACNGNKERAARVLEISLKTLYNRLNAYNGRGKQRPASPVGPQLSTPPSS